MCLRMVYVYIMYITVASSGLDVFTDGLWHSVYVDIEAGSETRVGLINITVDGRADASNRQLSFTTTNTYYIGGKTTLILKLHTIKSET